VAKQTYNVVDERGLAWIVKQGDPSFGLVSKVRHPLVVLPRHTLITGKLHGHNVKVDSRIVRLTKGLAAMPDDGELAETLVRYVALRACLRELGDPTIEAVTKE
jgi:hypothetical protein